VRVITKGIVDKGIYTLLGNVCRLFAKNSHEAVASGPRGQ